jgi:hypothetical protein
MVLPVRTPANDGVIRIEVVQADVLCVEHDLDVPFLGGVEEILHHLLLAIHRHRPATGAFGEVDPERLAVARQPRTAMHETFAPQALIEAELRQHIDGHLFENPRPDPSLDVGTVPTFKDQAIDAGTTKLVGEQQARRARSNNRDLCAQKNSFRFQSGASRRSWSDDFIVKGYSLDASVTAEPRRRGRCSFGDICTDVYAIENDLTRAYMHNSVYTGTVSNYFLSKPPSARHIKGCPP